MGWVYLVIAGLFEIAWAVALKYSEGFSKLVPSVTFFVTAALSMWFLSMALKSLPIGSAYAVWTGIGAVGLAIIGMVWFSEPVTIVRIACIGLIVLGIIGLKLSGSATS